MTMNNTFSFIVFYIKILLILIGLYSNISHSQDNPIGLIMRAEGNQSYCANTRQPIVTDFSITDPDTNEAISVYIQIVSGYRESEDLLEFIGNENIFRSTWNSSEAKLTIRSRNSTPVPYSDIVAAVKSVVYSSKNPSPDTDKIFSISLGSANYLPSTNHYYEFVSDLNISWQQARAAAKDRTYYGLQGYLVTILAQDEALLVGELSPGVGWIGGSDEETEGVWKWMDGPEAGTVFWTGLASGESPNFAYWNAAEPNNFMGNEDYAHITDPTIGYSGSWNDLPNVTSTSGPYQSKGYIVEYGGMPGDPVVQNSASTKLFMPRILNASDAMGCEGQSLTIEVEASSDQLNWYDAAEEGNLVHTGMQYTNYFNEDKAFWLDWDAVGCPLEDRVKIQVKIFPYPVLFQTELTVEQCDNDSQNDGITEFNLEALSELISQNHKEETFEFYTEEDYNLTSKIETPTNFRNTAFEQRLYVIVNSAGGCYLEAQLVLKVAASEIELNSLFEYVKCETQIKDWALGIEGWDATVFETLKQKVLEANPKFGNQYVSISFYSSEEDALLRQNRIEVSESVPLYFMKTQYEEIIYARIDNLGFNKVSCLGVGPVALLRVNPLPDFDRISNLNIVCENLDPIPLGVEPNNDNLYEYRWFYEGNPFPDPNSNQGKYQETKLGGNYEIVATTTDGTNCSKTLSFTLTPSVVANVKPEDLIVVDLIGETGSLEIQTDYLGIGDYEFALYDSEGTYQDQPYFDSISPGIHQLYIRDKNGCGIIDIPFSILGHMKFFSPNGDGINDRWKILGLNEDFQPQSQIYIFDRYGRLITEISPTEEGWDGTINNSLLPQDDYWFRVFFQDGREYNGHFSLLRSL